MISAKQIAEKNYQKFLVWMKSKNNDDYKQIIFHELLSRKEIAAECCFARSELIQNNLIKIALVALEKKLRQQGILSS